MKQPKVSSEQKAGQAATQAQIDRSVASYQEFIDFVRSQMAKRGSTFDPLYSSLAERLPGFFDLATSPLDIGTPEGLSPESLAALKGQAIEGGGRFDEASRRVKAMLASRGLYGGTGTSGLAAAPLAEVEIAREQERAGALRGVTLADEAARRADLESRRNLAVQRRQLELGGFGSAFGAGSNLLGRALESTDVSPFVGGATSALGEAGRATGLRISPQLFFRDPNAPESMWRTFGKAAIGAGFGLLGDYLPKPKGNTATGGGGR